MTPTPPPAREALAAQLREVWWGDNRGMTPWDGLDQEDRNDWLRCADLALSLAGDRGEAGGRTAAEWSREAHTFRDLTEKATALLRDALDSLEYVETLDYSKWGLLSIGGCAVRRERAAKIRAFLSLPAVAPVRAAGLPETAPERPTRVPPAPLCSCEHDETGYRCRAEREYVPVGTRPRRRRSHHRTTSPERKGG